MVKSEESWNREKWGEGGTPAEGEAHGCSTQEVQEGESTEKAARQAREVD